MEIVRRGNDDGEMAPPPAHAQIECARCGSLLKITQKDVQEDDCGMLHHHTSADSFVDCPVCKNIVPITSRTLVWSR
jgi:phage FluMu protein Com